MPNNGADCKLRVLTNVKKMRNGDVTSTEFTKAFEREIDIVVNDVGDIFDLYEINAVSQYDKTKYNGVRIKKTIHIPKLHILMRYKTKNDKKQRIMV